MAAAAAVAAVAAVIVVIAVIILCLLCILFCFCFFWVGAFCFVLEFVLYFALFRCRCGFRFVIVICLIMAIFCFCFPLFACVDLVFFS